MVESNKDIKRKVKGKFCHFQKKEFIQHNLMDFYFKKIESINLEDLRDKIKGILEKEGFVFYEDSLEYKYRTYAEKLIEFAIQYHHIK